MKVLYKPFAVIAGVIGAKIGRRVFQAVWAKLDSDEPPKPTRREASTGKIVAAAALEAAAHSGAKAATTRATARSFHHLTGFWPGEEAKVEKENKKQKEKRG
jgi:xanthosine utilization system XapX-like protein